MVWKALQRLQSAASLPSDSATPSDKWENDSDQEQMSSPQQIATCSEDSFKYIGTFGGVTVAMWSLLSLGSLRALPQAPDLES